MGDNYLISGSKYVFPYARQAWLLALASDGSVVWEKTFGGPQDDSANEVIPVPGEGFLMAGQTKSFGTGDGKSDVWLVALDAGGNTRWTKTYNLGSEDMGTSIAPFGSGRFIIATTPCTANCDNLFRQGFAGFIVVDAAGNILTSQTFTEGPKNALGKVKPTRDGGAVLVGSTSVVENFPSADTRGVKLDSQANVVWTSILRSYGRYDGGFDIIQAPDEGYIVAAYSQAYQTPELNFDNFCMLRLDSHGNFLWIRLWAALTTTTPIPSS